jgi:hypothetical protein
MSTRAGMPASRSAWPRTSGIQQLPRTCEQSSKPAVSSCGRCAHERPVCHHEDGARLRLLWPATARGWDQPRGGRPAMRASRRAAPVLADSRGIFQGPRISLDANTR